MTFLVAQGVSLDIVEQYDLVPSQKIVIDDIQWSIEDTGSSYFLEWVVGAPVGTSKTSVNDAELVRIMDKYNEFRAWLKCCVCGAAIQPNMEWSPSLLDGGKSIVCSEECRRHDDKPIELNSQDPFVLRLKSIGSDEWLDMLEEAVGHSSNLSHNIRGSDALMEVVAMAHSRVKTIAESARHNNEDGFATLYVEGFFLGMMFGKMIAEE